MTAVGNAVSDTVSHAVNDAALRRLLAADRVWSAYALADLQPAFARHCRWLLAGEGLALIFTALAPPVLFTCGAPADVSTALEGAERPATVYMSARPEHYPVLNRWWDFSADLRPMMRMALADAAALQAVPTTGAVPLGPPDAQRLAALYAHGGDFAPDAFDPYQLDEGVFFGVAGEGGALLAAGGTHIVDRGQGIAAIGNMYTLPAARGRGLAGVILSAVVTALRQCNVQTIVLNVDERNATARRLYRRLGFADHCAFFEGVGQRRRP